MWFVIGCVAGCLIGLDLFKVKPQKGYSPTVIIEKPNHTSA